jgi:hypothetical protein
MKEKKFILLYDLIDTYQQLSTVFSELFDTLGGEPNKIGVICDKMVNIIIRAFGVKDDDPDLEYYLDEFYDMAEEDPENVISDMEDTIKLKKSGNFGMDDFGYEDVNENWGK